MPVSLVVVLFMIISGLPYLQHHGFVVQKNAAALIIA